MTTFEQIREVLRNNAPSLLDAFNREPVRKVIDSKTALIVPVLMEKLKEGSYTATQLAEELETSTGCVVAALRKIDGVKTASAIVQRPDNKSGYRDTLVKVYSL